MQLLASVSAALTRQPGAQNPESEVGETSGSRRRSPPDQALLPIAFDLNTGIGERSKGHSRISHFGSKIQYMPAELRQLIYSYFDYSSALSLDQVNLFFHHDVPADSITLERGTNYVFHAQMASRNEGTHIQDLGCYGCLRVLRCYRFNLKMQSGWYERSGTLEHARKCKECEAKQRRDGWDPERNEKLFELSWSWKSPCAGSTIVDFSENRDRIALWSE